MKLFGDGGEAGAGGEAHVVGIIEGSSPASVQGSSGFNAAYDLHPDGTRVATSVVSEQGGVQDKVVFVFNFADYLRTIAPGTKLRGP